MVLCAWRRSVCREAVVLQVRAGEGALAEKVAFLGCGTPRSTNPGGRMSSKSLALSTVSACMNPLSRTGGLLPGGIKAIAGSTEDHGEVTSPGCGSVVGDKQRTAVNLLGFYEIKGLCLIPAWRDRRSGCGNVGPVLLNVSEHRHGPTTIWIACIVTLHKL